MGTRKYELEVGQQFGFLTVTQNRPRLELQCACGKLVTGVTPWELTVAGRRSCGCKKRQGQVYVSEPIKEVFTVLEVAEAAEKAAYRSFHVKCKLCGRRNIMKQSSLKYLRKRKFGCMFCSRKNKENRMKKTKADQTVIRLTLEPHDDAELRRYCAEKSMTYSSFIRQSLYHLLERKDTLTSRHFPSQQEIYGKLGKQAVSAMVSRIERKEIFLFAKDMNINGRRSYSRIMRQSISDVCALLRDGKDPFPVARPAYMG